MKRLNHNFITGTIVTQHDYLFCAIIKPGIRKPLCLAAQCIIPCNQLELQNSYLFNPTAIDRALRKFFTHKKIPLTIALSGSGISEQLNYGDEQTTSLAATQKNSLTQKQHIFTHHVTQKPCWYSVTIPHSLLLQYQLMSIRLPRNLSVLTTYRMALLALYQYCYGSAFRSAQLALDMYKRNNVIEALFDSEQIFHLIENYDPSILPQIKQALLPAMGLAIMQGDTHETN